MAFLLSRCVGLVTPEPGVAAMFYQNHFDMRLGTTEAVLELVAGPVRIYLDPGQPRPAVLELVTEDLAQARADARKFGFEELCWRGEGQSCLVRDPFGLVFNVFEDRTAFLPIDLEPPEPGFVKACVGALVPEPEEVADFYADILESMSSRLPDGSYIVDSGAMRMRFRNGDSASPVVWLKPDAPTQRLAAAGCHRDDSGVLRDPFGMQWCVESITAALCAVCCPL